MPRSKLSGEQRNTIGDLIDRLYGSPRPDNLPVWPPDMFALVGVILRASGAHVHSVELAVPDFQCLPDNWPRVCQNTATSWKKAWNKALGSASLDDVISRGAEVAVPDVVYNEWKIVCNNSDVRLNNVSDNRQLSSALIKLCGFSDAACSGVGISKPRSDDRFLDLAGLLLAYNGFETLCASVDADELKVLPKQHTPQRGMTLRSLSHNLALLWPSEVRAKWQPTLEVRYSEQPDIINLLLLPWPLDLTPGEFATVNQQQHGPLADGYRFFRYKPNPENTGTFAHRLESVIGAARKYVDTLDGIIMPELAMTYAEYLEAERRCLTHKVLLVGGVSLSADEAMALSGRSIKQPANAVVIQPGGLSALSEGIALSEGLTEDYVKGQRIVQFKHHRWCLDRSQILQYGLGGVVPASHECWELSHIGRRSLHFVTLGEWFTMAAVICEDLARQDPISDVVRSVAPSVLIALLMDGPQLKGRWGARYASVLAEDPGTSVLTLTSLGMSKLSKPLTGENRCRTIALWRDQIHGEREITLDEGASGCILSLVRQTRSEHSADGRSDGWVAHTPVFAGLHQIQVPPLDE